MPAPRGRGASRRSRDSRRSTQLGTPPLAVHTSDTAILNATLSA